mmetsp:Transcript_36427/g.27015  ORF Transcript_36427/g.27015 Transcript_36427/m.27015 type:complete len:127 (-) Transcript_36427:302-682(-)
MNKSLGLFALFILTQGQDDMPIPTQPCFVNVDGEWLSGYDYTSVGSYSLVVTEKPKTYKFAYQFDIEIGGLSADAPCSNYMAHDFTLTYDNSELSGYSNLNLAFYLQVYVRSSDEVGSDCATLTAD